MYSNEICIRKKSSPRMNNQAKGRKIANEDAKRIPVYWGGCRRLDGGGGYV